MNNKRRLYEDFKNGVSIHEIANTIRQLYPDCFKADGEILTVELAEKFGVTTIQYNFFESQLIGFLAVGLRAYKWTKCLQAIVIHKGDTLLHKKYMILYELAYYLLDFDSSTQEEYYHVYSLNEDDNSFHKIANAFAREFLAG